MIEPWNSEQPKTEGLFSWFDNSTTLEKGVRALSDDQRVTAVPNPDQLSLFAAAPAPKNEVLEEIVQLDLNEMTPMQALQFLARAKEKSLAAES